LELRGFCQLPGLDSNQDKENQNAFEIRLKSKGDKATRHFSSAVCTPVCTKPSDPELARVVEVWPSLPAPIRAAVLALVSSVAPTPGIAPDVLGNDQNE
jgi:hypothetical protein